MELTEALRTTGAVREFTDEPVDEGTVRQLLDSARFAPNGGNRQAWRVVVVQDPVVRRTLRDLYLPGWYEYLAQVSAGLTPWAAVTDRDLERRAVEGVEERAQRLDQVGAEQLRRADAVEHEGPAFWPLQGLAQELPEVVNLHPFLTEHLGERVVLLLGLLGPQHIVEEQLADVPRGQSGQLESGPVHDDLAEPSHLGSDVEGHRRLPSLGPSCGAGTWPRFSRRAFRKA